MFDFSCFVCLEDLGMFKFSNLVFSICLSIRLITNCCCFIYLSILGCPPSPLSPRRIWRSPVRTLPPPPQYPRVLENPPVVNVANIVLEYPPKWYLKIPPSRKHNTQYWFSSMSWPSTTLFVWTTPQIFGSMSWPSATRRGFCFLEKTPPFFFEHVVAKYYPQSFSFSKNTSLDIWENVMA